MNDILGPAVDIPEFLAALTLLQIRGCLVTWRPPAPNALEVYEVGYRYPGDVPVTEATTRGRLFYADHRGTQQALQLLKELNDYPDTRGLRAAMQETIDNVVVQVLAKAFTGTEK